MASKSHKRRWVIMQQIGCLACIKHGLEGVPADVNHMLNGYRMGHDKSYSLCPFHHRGVGKGLEGMISLRLESKAFHEKYGTDAELLELQNRLIADFESTIIK